MTNIVTREEDEEEFLLSSSSSSSSSSPEGILKKEGFFKKAGKGFYGGVEEGINTLDEFSRRKTGNESWLQNFDDRQDYRNAWEGFKTLFDGEVDTRKGGRDLLEGEGVFTKTLIDFASAPIVGGFSGFMPGEGEQVEGEEGFLQKVGRKIGEVEEGVGEGISSFLEGTTGEGLDEFNKRNLGVGLTEGLIMGAGAGASKVIGKTGKYATKGILYTSKKIGEIRINNTDVMKSYDSFNASLDKQANIFETINYTPEKTTAKFEELLTKLGNGDTNLKEVSLMAKELKIDDTIYIKKLEEITNNKYYKSSTLTNKIAKLDIGVKEKTFKKIENRFNELGLSKSTPKKDRAYILKKVEGEFNQSDVNKSLSYMENPKLSKNAEIISSYLEQANIKHNGGKEFYDTLTDTRKGDLLKKMEDNGLISKSVVDGQYSFKYTDKGIRELKNVDYNKFSGNNFFLKEGHIENGLAHYPIDKYKIVSDKIDEGKVISYAEVNGMVNELSGDVDFSAIDSMVFKKSAGETVSNEKMAFHIDNISKRYGLKNINEDIIEKIKLGDEGVIKKVFEDLEELKRNEFVTIDRIKNPGKTINFATQTGVTSRLFKTLYKNVETLSKGDLNKKLGTIKSKIDGTRKAILRKYKGDEITIRTKLKNLRSQHKAQILSIKAKYGGIEAVKQELKANIRSIGKSNEFKGNINAVIRKALLPKNWENINEPDQLRKKIGQINKNIELEHTRGLIKEIKDKLKKAKITKKNKGTKAGNIEIEKALQLEQAGRIFSRIKTGDLDVKDLQSLLDEIDEVNSTGRSKKLAYDKKYAIEINKEIEDISKDVKKLKGTKNVDNKRIGQGFFASYDNASLFANRLIEKIFDRNKKAMKYFVDDVSKAYNRYMGFEIRYTDKLAKTIGLLFKNNVEKMEEWGQFLYARRRIVDEKGIHFVGIDRLMNDKTSSFYTKLDVPLEDVKPKGWEELSDEIWEEIRKTELGNIMMKADEFKKANNLRDKFHKLTGEMANKTRMEVDNQYVEMDEFYISFQAKRGPNENIDGLGQDGFMNKYINTSPLKSVNKKVLKGYVWDYNPISSLYGSGKKVRYYSFMQETHKNMISLYDGKSTAIKNMTVDEYNDLSKNPDQYVKSVNGEEIRFIDDILADTDGMVNVEVKYKKADGSEKWIEESVSLNDIKVKSVGSGLADKLSEEGMYRLKKYIDRVGTGGSTITETSEKVLAMSTNHFNRLPLMGSLSVVLKQPLSLIDAQGRIGPKNLAQAEIDLLSGKNGNIFGENSVSKLLNNIPSIHNRAGGDFLIEELRNKTPGSGWLNTLSNKYNGYVDVVMAPIKHADQWTYKKIWLGAYREALIKKKIITSNQRITPDMIKNIDPKAMAYADDIANKSASTANPLMLPQLYDRAWSKALFGIFTTQLNRLQIMYKDVPNLYKDGNKAQAIYLGASLMTANIAEYAVTVAVGKLMLELGGTTWEGYGEDWEELMVNKDLLVRVTIGQTFIGSKYEGLLNPAFGVAPIMGGLMKLAKDMEELKADPNFETITNIPADFIGGKIAQQIHTGIFK